MNRSVGKGRGLALAVLAVGMGIAGLAGARPAGAQDCSAVAPYVFVLLDTSGSMSWAPPCSQAEVNAGLCAWRCDSFDCWVPMQGDAPSSKFYQIKQALYDVLANTSGVQLGFATFNMDSLNVRSKHWLYEAAGNGITIPGWGPFPSTGAREAFGYLWPCDTGSGDHEIGCYPASPADLVDGWELGRVQQLPKLGKSFTEAVIFYIRQSGVIYKVRYAPVPGAVPGSPATVTEAVWRCTNIACSASVSLGQTNISFNPVGEFLFWDNAGSTILSRVNPELEYFAQYPAADTTASNTCSGWEPNSDSTADVFNGYNLHQPTSSTDARGSAFSVGDVIPMDWLTDHRDDVLHRLAPNLILDPTAAPDFGQSSYLRDSTQGSDTFLRLKNEITRPLFVVGSTPVANAMNNFKAWYSTPGSGWSQTAAVQDPDWPCRRKYLLVLTDGDESCNGDPCSLATTLRTTYGISTYVVGFGMASGSTTPGNKLQCMAANGGTSVPYTPYLRQDLEDTLNSILTSIKTGI